MAEKLKEDKAVTFIPLDFRTMEQRESEELYSVFSNSYNSDSGVVIQSLSVISNKTAQGAVAVYNVAGSGATYVYEGAVGVVSSVWGLLQWSVYLAVGGLGIWFVSQTGSGLKNILEPTTKKRRIK
jgi:hypothetical protein